MAWRILYGFGGCGNFGDDYMLDCWVRHFKTNRPELNLCVVRPDRWLEGFYSKNCKFNLNFSFHDLLQEAISSLRGVTNDHIEHNILAGKKAASQILSTAAERKFLLELECIQMFGGGYWNRRYAEPWGLAAMLSEISMALNVPLIATGVGVTPTLQKNRKSVDEIISRFDLIEVRDIESYNELSNKYPGQKVIFGSDDTFISPVRTKEYTKPSKSAINICVQSNLAGDESHPKILKRILEFISGYETNFDLNYLQFDDVPDQIFLEKLQAALGKKIKRYSKNEMLSDGLPIKPVDVCISTRFHMHLLAARVGAKGAYVATGDEYYNVKHKSVSDLGSNWANLLSSTQRLSEVANVVSSPIEESRERVAKLSRLSAYL